MELMLGEREAESGAWAAMGLLYGPIRTERYLLSLRPWAWVPKNYYIFVSYCNLTWEKRRGVRNSCPRLNLFYLFTSKCKCSVMHDINGNKTGKSFGDLN